MAKASSAQIGKSCPCRAMARQTHFDAERLAIVHGARQNVVGTRTSAEAQHRGDASSLVWAGRRVEGQHVREDDGVGQPMGKLEPRAQRIGQSMATGGIDRPKHTPP